MDDGQSRTFKVRFEGEGVDDYGGPYREVFQKVCEELQTPDPSLMRSMSEGRDSDAELSGERTPAPCFLPLLLPTANWTAGQECAERYKYTFHPASTSAALLDLFLFLGQVVGIALRSRITLDLPLASFIWKSVVREPLTDNDIASFDAAACSYVQYLGSICQRLHADMDSNEALDGIRDEASYVLQDVTWTVTYSDGRVVELVPNGKHKNVDMNDLSEYLRLYVESRLAESLLMIDIERLKANTEYDDDVSPSDSHIVAFWEVLSEFSEEEKAAFLRFVWARPTLPPKDVDFPQKLKIQSAVGDDASSNPDGYLPKVMAEKLRYAVVHCTEMDADFRVTEPDVVGWSAMITAPGLSNYSGTD
ncbi:HERC1 [Symbiodinium microadriaticum]|nr:HERC1 [Symbiodinium microadriaticum]